MSNNTAAPTLVPTSLHIRPASDHGWVRAPARDLPCAWAWDLPSGALVWVPAGREPFIVTRRVP